MLGPGSIISGDPNIPCFTPDDCCGPSIIQSPTECCGPRGHVYQYYSNQYDPATQGCCETGMHPDVYHLDTQECCPDGTVGWGDACCEESTWPSSYRTYYQAEESCCSGGCLYDETCCGGSCKNHYEGWPCKSFHCLTNGQPRENGLEWVQAWQAPDDPPQQCEETDNECTFKACSSGTCGTEVPDRSKDGWSCSQASNGVCCNGVCQEGDSSAMPCTCHTCTAAGNWEAYNCNERSWCEDGPDYPCSYKVCESGSCSGTEAAYWYDGWGCTLPDGQGGYCSSGGCAPYDYSGSSGA